LASYSCLSVYSPRWEKMATRRGNASASELRDALQSLRATCLRSFPERLADIKASSFGKGPPGEIGTSVADVTISVCYYVV
jgi:exocyst complex protein 7